MDRISIRDFRNLAEVEICPDPELNVILGNNGQGKTSVLEAIYAVATTRSFRTDRVKELIRHEQNAATVKASICEGGLGREQIAVLGQSGNAFSSDGKRAKELARYATRTPVVIFHPGDLELVSGGASGRRTLLDRVALYLEPGSLDHRRRYTRALQSRQQVLRESGPRAPELGPFEELVALHGVQITAARQAAVIRLGELLEEAFSRVAAPGLELGARYVPGGTLDREEFARELLARRASDGRRQQATFGPQRDELEIRLGGHLARREASQGQQRVLALALKLAELGAVRGATSLDPILLLDDFSSELDASRTGAVYAALRDATSQVFVTTTRPELFRGLEKNGVGATFEVENGQLNVHGAAL